VPREQSRAGGLLSNCCRHPELKPAECTRPWRQRTSPSTTAGRIRHHHKPARYEPRYSDCAPVTATLRLRHAWISNRRSWWRDRAGALFSRPSCHPAACPPGPGWPASGSLVRPRWTPAQGRGDKLRGTDTKASPGRWHSGCWRRAVPCRWSAVCACRSTLSGGPKVAARRQRRSPAQLVWRAPTASRCARVGPRQPNRRCHYWDRAWTRPRTSLLCKVQMQGSGRCRAGRCGGRRSSASPPSWRLCWWGLRLAPGGTAGQLRKLWHEVRLPLPQHVDAYLKPGKNDAERCAADLRGGWAAEPDLRVGEEPGSAGGTDAVHGARPLDQAADYDPPGGDHPTVWQAGPTGPAGLVDAIRGTCGRTRGPRAPRSEPAPAWTPP
jgi:hypothetical protein